VGNLNEERGFPNYVRVHSALSLFTRSYGQLRLSMHRHWNRDKNNCCFMYVYMQLLPLVASKLITFWDHKVRKK